MCGSNYGTMYCTFVEARRTAASSEPRRQFPPRATGESSRRRQCLLSVTTGRADVDVEKWVSDLGAGPYWKQA